MPFLFFIQPPVRQTRLAACLLVGALLTATGVCAHPDSTHALAEQKLMDVLEHWRAGRFTTALHELGDLVQTHPDFRLAQFLYGEALLARAGNAEAITTLQEGNRNRLSALVYEARLRWRHHRHAPPAGAIPNAVLLLAPGYQQVIVVDLLRNRLYLFANEKDGLRLVADYYASIGTAGVGKELQGDKRTPVGVYHITGFKPDPALPDYYGDGAFPLNYPNAWDRALDRTGYGIWLHGVPKDTYNRPPLASKGCVVVSNEDLRALAAHIRPGVTPVVLTDELEWLTSAEALRARRDFLATVDEWSSHHLGQPRNQDGPVADPLQARASTNGVDEVDFSAYAHKVSLTAERVAPRLEDLSVFSYPGEDRMMLVSFTRQTGGANAPPTRVHQYWRRNPVTGWQIVVEEPF